MSEEKEMKWDASRRGDFNLFLAALEYAVGPLPLFADLAITDYYLDNEKGDFSARRMALRIRRQKGRYEATLKGRSALKNGLARRVELTKPLACARSFSSALRALQRESQWEKMPLYNLRVRFVLRNRRRSYKVRFGNSLCEASLDRYVIFAAERRLARKEIELEMKGGTEKDFLRLVRLLTQRSGLPFVRVSKVASAEKLLQEQKFVRTNL